MELEEELRVVGNNLKSLEVSEEKVGLDFNYAQKISDCLPNSQFILHSFFDSVAAFWIETTSELWDVKILSAK